jgi:hypothetical protein
MRTLFSMLSGGAPALLLVLATSAMAPAQLPKATTQSGAISGVSENGLAGLQGSPIRQPASGRFTLASTD